MKKSSKSIFFVSYYLTVFVYTKTTIHPSVGRFAAHAYFYIRGVLNKTIILLALVGYEMIVSNMAQRAS